MTLKGEIIYAFTQELKALLANESCTILVKTDFKQSQMPSFKLPCVEVDMRPSDDSGEFLGGLAMEDYHCVLSVYNTQQAVPEDITDYSATRVDIADIVRQQFLNFSLYLSAEMNAAVQNYGMRLTYAGSGDAAPLEHAEGLVMGTAIRFNVVAFDNTKCGSQYLKQYNSGTVINGTNN